MTQEHADVWIRDKVYDKTNATENTKSASNPPLLLFRRLGIFVLSIDAPVDSAV